MFAAQRHERLLAALRASGAVRVTDLVESLDASEVTVRRDIRFLADRGLLQRVHGGAVLTVPGSAVAPSSPGPGHHPGAHAGSAAPGAGAPGAPPSPPTAARPVGVVVPSLDFYYPSVVRGAQSAAAVTGSRLVMRTSGYSPAEEHRLVAGLVDAGVAGLLVSPSTAGRAGHDLVRWLGTLTTPLVLVERVVPSCLPAQRLEWVATDHAHGAGLAVRHLAALGHRRVGLLASRGSPTTPAVRDGWREALDDLGAPDDRRVDTHALGMGEDGWREHYDAVLARCRTTSTTALLVHSDHEAAALAQHARDRGVQVPGDLALVSYDDEVAAAVDPPLTAVRPPKDQLGRTAVEVLTARLRQGPERPVHRVQLLPQLVVRASCGASS